MVFTPIHVEHWERREQYRYFTREACGTYSVCVDLDLSALRGKQRYPTLLWLMTQTVNQMPEFRTALTEEGLGCFDEMHPAYTIFNPEQKTFSGIWTAYHPAYHTFLARYAADVAKYSSSTAYPPKPGRPLNSFDVSMVPWFSFTGFHLHVFGGGTHFLPIFTMGRAFASGRKQLLPLAIQVHRAVCGEYHVGKWVELLQTKINAFEASHGSAAQ